MKVCFISGSYPPILCGIGDFAQRLATQLGEQGVSVQILTSKEGVSAERDGAVTIRPVVRQWNFSALPAILAEVRALAPDLVNIQYPTQRYGRQPLVNLLPIFIRARLHIPVITTVHEFSTYRRLGRWRVGLSVVTSDQVIVTDQTNLAQMERAFPNARSKLHRIPIGANIEPQLAQDFDRRRVRASIGATDSDVVIAYFGFISPSKGIEILLHAFKRARLEYPDLPLRLLLIASREPSEPRYAAYHHMIEQMLDALQMGDRIYWSGYRPSNQVSAYLASADLAVLSFSDGASLRRTTMLSALAHGLPVLSTGDRAPCPGVQVTPIGDIAALSKAIVHLGGDRQLLTTLAAEARRAVANLSWPAIAHQTTAVFDAVLHKDTSKGV